MSTGFFAGLAVRLRTTISTRPRLRWSDINGMTLAVTALALTIVSTTLSEARFREADAERARIEAAATTTGSLARLCQRSEHAVREVRPSS